jgi:hypothetical protein
MNDGRWREGWDRSVIRGKMWITGRKEDMNGIKEGIESRWAGPLIFGISHDSEMGATRTKEAMRTALKDSKNPKINTTDSDRTIGRAALSGPGDTEDPNTQEQSEKQSEASPNANTTAPAESGHIRYMTGLGKGATRTKDLCYQFHYGA